MAVEGLYLYGIVGFPPGLPLAIQGVGGHRVSLLPSGDLAAVVSPSQLNPWSVDDAHLALHEAVVEELMQSRPIIPVRLNTFLKNEESVVSLLNERARAFRSALERVAGRVEVGLRVLWEPPRDVEGSAYQDVRPGGPGTEYLLRKLREEQRRARIRAAGEVLIREVHVRLSSLAVESWLQRFPTTRLLLTGAYLVERGRVDAFRGGVARAREEFSRLSFLLTGPWPPYHFVNGAQDETEDTLGT